MRQYREIVADLILTFETAAARYHRVCESLFIELSFSDAKYAEILDQPGGDQWKTEDVIFHARERLGTSLTPFVKLAQRIHKALLKFATRLELSPGAHLQVSYSPTSITLAHLFEHIAGLDAKGYQDTIGDATKSFQQVS